MQNILGKSEKVFCSLLLFVMLIILFMQVIARYLFQSSFGWSEELSRFLFIWFIFISMSYAALEKSHISIDVLQRMFPRKISVYLNLAGILVWITFNLIITVEGVKYTMDSFATEQIAQATRIQLGFIYVAIPIGFALTTLHLIKRLINKDIYSDEGQGSDI